jgi:hypothetical protein
MAPPPVSYTQSYTGGQGNFVKKSANRKSANSWAYCAIANPRKFLGCASLQIANVQFFMINREFLQNMYFTAQTNSHKSFFLKCFLYKFE